MAKNILFEQSAVKEVLQFLEGSYKWQNIHYLNKGRYAVAIGVKTYPNIAILFKKQWYLTFGSQNFIDESTGKIETGIGDTINSEDLAEFIRRKVERIYTLHSSGAIYAIPLHEFLYWSHPWQNKEGKAVRSISIHRYKRVNE